MLMIAIIFLFVCPLVKILSLSLSLVVSVLLFYSSVAHYIGYVQYSTVECSERSVDHSVIRRCLIIGWLNKLSQYQPIVRPHSAVVTLLLVVFVVISSSSSVDHGVILSIIN